MNEGEFPWALLARRAIERDAGEDPDPEALAEAAARLCQKLSREIAPLVGLRGFRAVLALALRLCQEDFLSLEGVQVDEGDAALLGLLPGLRGQDAPAGKEAVVGLLARTLDLLAGLTGAGLLHRHLLAAWPEVEDAAGGPNPETAGNGR